MANDHGNTEPMRLAGIELVAPSFEARHGSAGDGWHGDGEAGDGWAGSGSDVINGTPLTPEERAQKNRDEDAPAPVNRRHIPPAVLENMRKQVADFADFAHLTRLESPTAVLALGSGGGITAAVVETIAEKLFGTEAVAGLGASKRELTDSLLLALVAPGEPDELTEAQRGAFISVRGRLALDVSMAEFGVEPKVWPVSLDAAPGRQLAAADGQALSAADGHAAGPCAALIVGGAATIARERPYLTLDALMAYARRVVYEYQSPNGERPAAGGGLVAARNLEVVVLLEEALGGGLWIDVDRTTGRAAAALAIGLPESQAALRFTHVDKLRAPELRTQLPAGTATA